MKKYGLFDRFIVASDIVGGDEYLRKRQRAIDNLIYKEGINNLMDDLENNYIELKKEFYNTVQKNHYVMYPLTHLYEFGWNVVGLRCQGFDVHSHHKKYPLLSSIVKKYSSICRLVGYSLLESKSIIGIHRDSKYEMTVHLGITIPKGDCAFRMDDVKVNWEEGKTIMFYSHDPHEAWNVTDEDRIILIFDVKSRNTYQKIIHFLMNNKLFCFIFTAIQNKVYEVKDGYKNKLPDWVKKSRYNPNN
jgi:beta-hydroxylase